MSVFCGDRHSAIAPAKINLTLRVLGRRADGYHDLESVVAKVTLYDGIDLVSEDDPAIQIECTNPAVPTDTQNTIWRAIELLSNRAGPLPPMRVQLHKHIPLGAGLGGGSSDAAAVLRGLRELWQLDILDDDLARLAAELGSDVPFFLLGGTALAPGRGDKTEALPQMPSRPPIIAWPRAPRSGDKTARMYDALRPEHYTDGSRTERLVERLRAGEPIRDDDLYNIFETILPEVDPDATERFERAVALGFGQPHLFGSGPANLQGRDVIT